MSRIYQVIKSPVYEAYGLRTCGISLKLRVLLNRGTNVTFYLVSTNSGVQYN
jgi:hypothetical protein